MPTIIPRSLLLYSSSYKNPKNNGRKKEAAAKPNAKAPTAATNPGGLIPKYPATHRTNSR